jgi:hypothetical protein
LISAIADLPRFVRERASASRRARNRKEGRKEGEQQDQVCLLSSLIPCFFPIFRFAVSVVLFGFRSEIPRCSPKQAFFYCSFRGLPLRRESGAVLPSALSLV